MISTVTTAVSSVSSSGLSAILGGIAVAALIALLVQRELASAAGPRLQPLVRNLAVAIAPLLVVFLVIAVSRLWGLL